jgi:hypothetical protein
MNNRIRSLFSRKPFVVVFILVPASLFPLRTQAQLEVSIDTYAGSSDGSGNGGEIDTGEVTAPNPLVESATYESTYTTASQTVSASYSVLQAAGSCAASGSYGVYGGIAEFSTGDEGNSAFSSDELTVTSDTLPVGTPVQVLVTWAYSGFVNLENTVVQGNYSIDAGNVTMTFQGNPTFKSISGSLDGSSGSWSVSGSVSQVVNTTVGSVGDVGWQNTITISGETTGDEVDTGVPESASASASATNTVYVNVLTPGAGYTADSGTVYPQIPTLSIQSVANGVLLSWPGWASGFQLQQNSDLTTADWIANNSPVNLVNGTNEVTITPATGTLFFRLINP